MSKATEYAAWLGQFADGAPVPCDDIDQLMRDIAAELRRLSEVEQERDELLAVLGEPCGWVEPRLITALKDAKDKPSAYVGMFAVQTERNCEPVYTRAAMRKGE